MTQRALEIVRPGVQTLVVDRGRFGHRSIGVAWCGAMDAPALRRALAALRESPGAAALEIAYGGFEVRFTDATRVALAGADCGAALDGASVPADGVFEAGAGSTLALQAPRRGSRTILAVKGGFDVPICLGSRATDAGAGFGGFGGRALRRGDRVPILAEGPDAPAELVEKPQIPGDGVAVRVVPTHEHDDFDAQSRRAFWASEWKIAHESNRMGYRLEGPTLRFSATRPIRPHAVFPGVVQVPPGGAPIVLMSDAHTTGGYPKIGVVLAEDLWKIAQLRTGERVRFVEARS